MIFDYERIVSFKSFIRIRLTYLILVVGLNWRYLDNTSRTVTKKGSPLYGVYL